MNGSDRERVKDLLAQAALLAPHRRREFIEQAGENPRIAEEAFDLLSTLEDSAFLSEVTGAGVSATLDAAAPLLEGPGTKIGRYKLLQRIGEGGFGTVYMAEQTEPVVRRVALKIIKAGMDTRAVIARFEAERQALAMMDHPNIARVFDAGATETGRPYFVMELVRGDPVTHYCDREELLIGERLALFRDVCGAVQHAHQKGVIHRDIKPSNVLVTVADGRPIPKIIDFGIAKATSARLTDKTLFTEHRQLVGTPQYMSPEQAEVSGIDIDTRSDIYSLGVLLYELLAGEPPFDARRLCSAPLAEIQRIIRDEEPPRPSLRLRTRAASSNIVVLPSVEAGRPSTDLSAVDIARRRGTEPLLLARSMSGDLDWIVMKCLEKDRSRRYETAAALAGDITRYLSREPVSATPPSVGYKLRKFAQRHRGAVLAGAAIAVTLVIAFGVSVGFALRASRALDAEETQRKLAEKRAEETEVQRKLAEKRAEETARVAQFQQMQLGGIDPELMGGRLRDDFLAEARAGMERAGLQATEIADRQEQLANLLADANPTNVALQALDENIFERALQAANEQFADQPLVKAKLLQTLVGTLIELGLFERAMPAQTEALAIRRHELGDDDPQTIGSINSMAVLLTHRSKYAEAEVYARELLERRSRIFGADHPETLVAINNVGLALLMQGKRDEAEPYFRDLLEDCRRIHGDDDPATLMVMNNVGGMLFESGKFAAAEPLFRESFERRQRVLGENHVETLGSMSNLALTLEKLGRLTDAEPLYHEAFERSRRAVGEDHPQTLLYMSNLGFLSCTLEKMGVAEKLTPEALERRRRVLSGDHRDLLQSMHNLGELRQAQGRFDEADRLYRDACEGRRRAFGDAHGYTLQSVAALGVLLRVRGRLDEAEPYLREALEKRRQSLGNDHVDTLESVVGYGDLLVDRGAPAEAEPLYREVLAHPPEVLPVGHPMRLAAQIVLARSLLAQTKADEAETLLSAVMEIESTAGLVGVPKHHKQCLIKGCVELYDAKDRMTPNQGFDRQASEWRAKLEPEDENSAETE